MPPQSRGPSRPGPVPSGFQSKSSPSLPSLRSLRMTPAGDHTRGQNASQDSRRMHAHRPGASYLDDNTSTSESAPIEDYGAYPSRDPPFLLSGASDDEVNSAEEDGHVPNLPAQTLHGHHSRSHTHLGPLTFAPPFYNRPPTPLPPSPSLTSLLRPNFSSQNSRPVTPDHSSDDGHVPHSRPATGTQTPNSAAASTLDNTYRTAKTIPRASPKIPTYEYYGFTLYLTSSLAFIVYVLWAFLPSPFLHQLGISYYPNRWWALAIPAWTVMFVVYIYVALAAYNLGYLTLPLTSVDCLVDEAAQIAVVDEHGQIIRNERPSWRSGSPERNQASTARNASANRRPGLSGKGINGGHSRQGSMTRIPTLRSDLDWRTLWMEGTDAVMDIPVGGVCEILYGEHDDDSDDDTPYA